MKLFSVSNGFMGNDAIHVLVIERDARAAEVAAQSIFKAKDPRPAFSDPAHFEVLELCPDTTRPWGSGVMDGSP